MSIHTSFTLTTYTNGTGNELTGAVPSSGSPTTQTFDLNGNLLTQQIGGAYTTYTWDYENRLASVALPAGTSVTNTYLPNNRILRLSDISGHLTTLTHDLSGANLIRRDVGGTAPATEHYTQSPKDFGGLLAQYTTASGNSRFYYPDMADNIGLLAKGSATPERHQFQAFGPVYMSSTAPTTQPYGFGGNAGYYTDPISGLQIAWNRVYDANVGQWANRDPIGYEGGDWESIYRYVANNPVRWSDPSGLLPYAPYPSPHGPLPGDYGQHCGGLISEPITTGSEDQIDECCAVHDGCLDYVDRTGWSWTWKTSGHLVCDANLCHCAKCAKCAMTPCAEERALIISYFCTSPHEGFPGSGFPSRKAPPCLPTENNACCTIDAYSGPPFHIKRKDNEQNCDYRCHPGQTVVHMGPCYPHIRLRL
jgi:RHS repeat-associated protein